MVRRLIVQYYVIFFHLPPNKLHNKRLLSLNTADNLSIYDQTKHELKCFNKPQKKEGKNRQS